MERAAAPAAGVVQVASACGRCVRRPLRPGFAASHDCSDWLRYQQGGQADSTRKPLRRNRYENCDNM